MLQYRHERKFLCPERNLLLTENRIRHICRPDTHVCATGDYVVRSLYFDSYDDRCLQENEAGTDERKKYRIRLYNGDADTIRLECKYSRHNRKAKEICKITKKQCEALIRGERVSAQPKDQELLECFLYERQMYLLSPKVIVEYVRTPYVYEFGNVRITFDRSIRSSSDIFHFMDKTIAGRGVLPQEEQLMEIKYDEFLPSALSELVRSGQDLNETSFSKYALCRRYSIM